VDGFKGDFKLAETEGRVAARVEANVGELFVSKGDDFFGIDGEKRLLHIVRRRGIAVPIGANADAGAVDRPQHERVRRIVGEVEFNGTEAANQDVFQDLLDEGAEGIFGIGLLEVQGERSDALGGAGQHGEAVAGEVATGRRFFERAATARLNAPGHAGDAVLDRVDGLARDRRFREAAQVGRCGFGHDSGTSNADRGCPRSEDGR